MGEQSQSHTARRGDRANHRTLSNRMGGSRVDYMQPEGAAELATEHLRIGGGRSRGKYIHPEGEAKLST